MADIGGLKILVADDTDTDRLILESIVKKEGHNVISAKNGVEAVEAFEQEHPDIVLLDALMPELDGFGAARRIKALAGEELVPIIFLTSLTDSDSLVKCLDAGGDDFLSKPYSRVILQAKIKSFNRMREMHATMLAQRDQIARHNYHLIQEQTVAKQVFDNIAHTGCLDASNVKHYLSPKAVFNGDVLVAAMRPSGSMMVLLGDFTGHGLPAAIGAMPLASTFYGMVRKGFSMTDILREINQKLKSILPVGVFCCAAIIDMNFRRRRLKVWNGGLPDCFIYRYASKTIESIRSTHLPVGVLSNKEFKDDCVHIELSINDRFFMWSDGIHEARNASGEMFGEARLKDVFDENRDPKSLFEDILFSVQCFVGKGERGDDLSLVEIEVVEPENIHYSGMDLNDSGSSGLMEWTLDFELKPSTFRNFDPLPLLLNIFAEVPGLRRYSGSLYTILSELYSNALEHGILQLESNLKATPEGFEQYYRERARRLAEVTGGYICFHFSHVTSADGGTLTMVVKDSGNGFNYRNRLGLQPITEGYSGRGITLISTMCASLRYLGEGNEVEVVFSWRNDE